ncbi:UvrD-helicase domain-containing protein [Desulfosarcina sp. OttesenSCG-928-A07]|nr:UvrD-helicase domain-containing protein [Desulfosarcina sp. OttesenSCG-928-G17]MDL2328366.1 UvrD-helicase domain-containing protein [Desulfosarcina sp. OttesenSCG-928-A07]
MKNNRFIADLHIHSKYSRATAKNLDLEHLYIWAQCKGIAVVGTGDFTHPAWFSEILEKLEPAEPGLYRLKPDIEKTLDDTVPASCRAPVRFMLSCEISNIYKKNDKTRKNHNLVFFPELDDVRKFNHRLEKIGNIHSDGRPILGLDARDLLEITLETSASGFLVPAHIWTPWFSMLGSKSGFDSISECFEDLSHHIFAAETGLSSDPPMNWRVPDLDQVTLISNSDAHSPDKLGREANLFRTELSYYAIRTAIENADKERFLGTLEFYPEEGKYHVDGHRKCGICFSPQETNSHQGMCPVCEKPLTLGVLHRVEDLAKRNDGFLPERVFPFYSLIPLETLLSEIFQVGPKSKKVSRHYWKALESLGSELFILHDLNLDQIDTAGIPLLAEAVLRMRENRVLFSPGYDGCFGTVRIFSDAERAACTGQHRFFEGFEEKKERIPQPSAPLLSTPRAVSHEETAKTEFSNPPICLNPDQQQAVDHEKGHLMIIAGPGTGKTRTLTERIGRIIQSGQDIRRILAVTFTRKAADEMRQRLRARVGKNRPLPFVGTFHALGYEILREFFKNEIPFRVIDENQRKNLVRDALLLNRAQEKEMSPVRVETLMQWIALAKQNRRVSRDPLADICQKDQAPFFRQCYASYEKLMELNGLLDFEDLVFRAVQALETHFPPNDPYTLRFHHILVDEYQDINASQYHLIRRLAGDHAQLCVIGDPDQSIYGFRGSDTRCFNWFTEDFPHTATVVLKENYRSTKTILEISGQVIRNNPTPSNTGPRQVLFSPKAGEPTISIMELDTERAEAVAIGKTIEKMMGGTGFFAIDAGKVDGASDGPELGFSDFAVLFRTRRQINAVSSALEKAGFPCQVIDRVPLLDHPGVKALLSIFRLIHGLGDFSDLETGAPFLGWKISSKIVETLKIRAYETGLTVHNLLSRIDSLTPSVLKKQNQIKLRDVFGHLKKFREKVSSLSLKDQIDFLVTACAVDDRFGDDAVFKRTMEILGEIAAAHPETDGADFLSAVALYRDTDLYDHRAQKVSLMTLHAAKGLEFPVVFIAGCEDGWIPLVSERRPTDTEEERRLFYVALTRAKSHLFLTRAKKRRINGKLESRQISPFVREIEEPYLRFSGQKKKASPSPVQQQLSLF